VGGSVSGVVRRVTSPVRFAGRRPSVAAGVAGLVVLAAGGGVYAYARYQWRAAQADLAADRPAEAKARLGFCLRVWPNDPEVHLLAARASRLSGDLLAVEKHLNRCLEIQGGASGPVQLEFLFLRIQTGDLDEVSGMLTQAVEDGHPDRELILETLSRAYIHNLRFLLADAYLSRWIEIAPETARAYQFRGYVRERLNQPKMAADDYRKALELDPGLLPVRLRMAEMYMEDKQTPEAVAVLEPLYRERPDDPQVMARLGMCRFLEGQSEEARRLMEAALPAMPTDVGLLMSLAKLDLQDGRPADAEARLRVILKSDVSDTEARHQLVSALQQQGKTEEAAEQLKEHAKYKKVIERVHQLIQTMPEGTNRGAAECVQLGSLLLSVGRTREGLYWLDQAVSREPGNQAAHRAFAEHYERAGEPDKAANHRRQLREPANTP
jgi:tetratricopeptide (TPR) repeat protein